MSLVNSTTTASTNITAPSTGSQSQVLPLLNVVNVTQSSLTPNQTQPTTDLTSSHEVAHLFSQYNSNATTTMPSISGMSTRAERRKARTPTSDSSAPTLRKKPGESAKGKSRQRRSAAAETTAAVTETAPGYKTDDLTFKGPDETAISTPRGLAPNVQCLLAEVKSMNEELENLKTKLGIHGDIYTKLELTDKDEMATYQKIVNTAKEYRNPYFYTQKGVAKIEDLNDITIERFNTSCKYKAIKIEDGNKQSMSIRSHIEIKNIPDGKILTVEEAKEKDMALITKYNGRDTTETGISKTIFDDLRTTWLSNTQWWNKTHFDELVVYLDSNKADPVFKGVKEMLTTARRSYESYIYVEDGIDEHKYEPSDDWIVRLEKTPSIVLQYLNNQSFGNFLLTTFASGAVSGVLFALFSLMVVACHRACDNGITKRMRVLEGKEDAHRLEVSVLKRTLLELKTSIQSRTSAAVSLNIPNVNNITPKDREAIETLLKKLSNKGTEEDEEITLDDLTAIRKLINRLDKNHAEEDQEPSTSGENKPKIKFSKTETDSEESEEIGSDSESEEIDSESDLEEKDLEETKASEIKQTEKTGKETSQTETSQTETSQSETSQTAPKKGEGDPPETLLNMSLKHKDKKKISCINFSCSKSKNKNPKAENLEENVLKSHQSDEEILGKDEGKDNNQPVETNESLKAQSEDLETIS